MYRTSQQQMNDVFAFGMALMFVGLMFGMVRSLVTVALQPEKKTPNLLPQTSRDTGWRNAYGPRGKWVALINGYPLTIEYVSYDLSGQGRYYRITTRYNREMFEHQFYKTLQEAQHAAETFVKKLPRQTPLMGNNLLLPQVLIEGSEPVPVQYRHLASWVSVPLPEYSLAVELIPAVEAVAGERKIDAVMKQLKDGVETIQQSDNFRLFLSTMAKFHDYSIGNLILIMIQKPAATHVAGFNTWKDLGRWVKSGEKGIAILAPVMPSRPTCPDCGAKLRKGVRFCPQCGKEVQVEEGIEGAPRFFRVVYVFDLSQTDGKPLPEFAVPVLTGEANEELFSKVLALAKSQGLTVSFEPRPEQDPEIKGFYSGKLIWVRPEEPRAQQLKTLLHEVAHYYSEGVFQIPRRNAETIAESAAFAVGAHFGFDTGVRSFSYVALWSQDKKVLEQNLAAIRKVSVTILESLEKEPAVELLPMIIKCAWCGKYMGEKPPYEDKGITHSICPECKAKHFPKKGPKHGDAA